MVIVTKTTVLAVGIREKTDALRKLPIRLICLKDGKQATGSLKNEKYHSVISHWNLPDMPDGSFLEGLRSIRPEIPTIAVIETQNKEQEMKARSLGVSAVVTEDCSQDHFMNIVRNVLHLKTADSVKEVYAVNEM